MSHEYRSWAVAVLVAIDQLGNAIAGGNPDSTISARVGYFSAKAIRAKGYWKILEDMIDFSFFPIDGPRHCYEAWQAEDEHFWRGSDFMRFILSVIIIIACPVIAILLYILVLFIRPWRYE